MLEALGIKVGSPEHAKYCKGTVIRNTNELVNNATEMLAVAAAHQYITEMGNESCIELAGEVMTSPLQIINEYFASKNGDSPADSSSRSAIALDPSMRPISITVTDQLILVARHFQQWARCKHGTTKRTEVGPSGYERASSMAEPQQEDPEIQAISQRIEADSANWPKYQRMNYFDDGDNLGVLSKCTNAGILSKSDRRRKGVLQKKLYLYEVEGNKEAALKFGPKRRVPQRTNSTAVALYDFIFGPERFALVQGHLLTRIRPKDMKLKKNQRYPREWLVFFKALTVSTFMRGQPNYQRLSLSFLIYLTMILKHDDDRCTDLALKRIRWTISVSEYGDSCRCYPLDLLIEGSLVEEVKKVGRRDPTAFRNLESRSLLRSYIRLQDIESRSSTSTNFSNVSPDRATRAENERRMSVSNVAVWVAILSDIHPLPENASAAEYDIIQGLGDDDLQVRHLPRALSTGVKWK